MALGNSEAPRLKKKKLKKEGVLDKRGIRSLSTGSNSKDMRQKHPKNVENKSTMDGTKKPDSTILRLKEFVEFNIGTGGCWIP